MNILEKIESMGFKVTWKLIFLGLYGFEGFSASISRSELLDYLKDCLGRNNNQTNKIISLIFEMQNDEEFDLQLNTYAENDQSIDIIQCRKWKAYILKTLLDIKYEDYFQGLLTLMEFWVSVGTTNDCPYNFLRDMSKLTCEFFTESKYQILLEKSSIWLKSEVEYILQQENELDGF